MLTAEPTYGRFTFQDWRNMAGEVVSTTPQFTSTLTGRVQLEATYVVTAAPALLGEYNLDGRVNAADFVLWRNTEGDAVAPFTVADGNGNGVIDDSDYSN